MSYAWLATDKILFWLYLTHHVNRNWNLMYIIQSRKWYSGFSGIWLNKTVWSAQPCHLGYLQTLRYCYRILLQLDLLHASTVSPKVHKHKCTLWEPSFALYHRNYTQNWLITANMYDPYSYVLIECQTVTSKGHNHFSQGTDWWR
jgi:hypothetical protein